MIAKYSKVLWQLLFVQILVTAVVFFYMGFFRAPEEPKMLLTINSNDVELMRIFGPGETSVSLTRNREGPDWILQDLGGFPANPQAVMQLIDRLTNTELGVKVSKQLESFDRMKVADNNFERKIEVGKSNDIRTIYFGSTPALRQAHARLNGEETVYAVKFAPGDIDLNASDWIKKDILVVSTSDIESIKVGNIKIQRMQMPYKRGCDNNGID